MASRFPAEATKEELVELNRFAPFNKEQEQLLLDTPTTMLLATFSGRPRDWLKLYKKVLGRTNREDLVIHDYTKRMAESKYRALEGKYKVALRQINDLEAEVDALVQLSGVEPAKLVIKEKDKRKKEATACIVASDWHAAEIIEPSKVNGKNSYDPDICTKRASRFFYSAQRLIDNCATGIQVNNIVLAILGDMANGELREESLATNAMGPIDEAFFVEGLLAAGIEGLLENNPGRDITVLFCYGNHGRLTKDIQWKRIKETNVEYVLGKSLLSRYSGNPRVRVRLADGYQLITDIHGTKIRWHHGHSIRYAGGIGGLAVPARRIIKDWNRGDPCDLDVFGHHHRFDAPAEYICNGSLCGYNEYAQGRGFPFEPPRQAFFLVDSRPERGRIGTWPVFVE